MTTSGTSSRRLSWHNEMLKHVSYKPHTNTLHFAVMMTQITLVINRNINMVLTKVGHQPPNHLKWSNLHKRPILAYHKYESPWSLHLRLHHISPRSRRHPIRVRLLSLPLQGPQQGSLDKGRGKLQCPPPTSYPPVSPMLLLPLLICPLSNLPCWKWLKVQPMTTSGNR